MHIKVGCANQKIDNIFKLICKLLFCVEVGQIKKALEWQQILPITSSENIVKYFKIELFMVAILQPCIFRPILLPKFWQIVHSY